LLLVFDSDSFVIYVSSKVDGDCREKKRLMALLDMARVIGCICLPNLKHLKLVVVVLPDPFRGMGA